MDNEIIQINYNIQNFNHQSIILKKTASHKFQADHLQ